MRVGYSERGLGNGLLIDRLCSVRLPLKSANQCCQAAPALNAANLANR